MSRMPEPRKERPHISVGDVVTLKKPHPCGSSTWEVLRTGADFRLKCTGCGHQVMMPRVQVEKSVRHVSPFDTKT